jgi:FAD/FMN-containing dehydrogenase
MRWDDLAARIDGTLVRPGDPGYDSVCPWFTGTFAEELPEAVVRCGSTADVVAVVDFARQTGVPFALRSGGNSVAGHSSTTGLLADFAAMKQIRLSDDGRTVTVQPGVRVGELNAALAGSGRVVPLVWMPAIGVAGAALGGGFGPLARLYGLASQHLEAAEVVLASGEVIKASQEEHADLWWALRGAGGGNFGAVTSLTFGTSEAVPAIDFAAWWEPEHAARVIGAWQRWAPHAPREINAELVLRATPDPATPPSVIVFGLVAGGDPERVSRMLRDLGETAGAAPVKVALTELSASALTTGYSYAGDPVSASISDGRPPDLEPGIRFIKSAFLDQPLPETAIAGLVDFFGRDRVAGQHRELEFVAWPGGSGRVLIGQNCLCFGSVAEKQAAHHWVTGAKARIEPYGTGRVYANYADPDLADWGQAYYGEDLARLKRIKAAYDPGNLFRFAQSIPIH